MITLSAEPFKPERWQAEVADPTDYWTRNLPSMKRDAYSGIACAGLAKIAHKVSNLSFFEVIFIGSLTFVATAMMRKAFTDYTFCHKCERLALYVTRKVPFLKLLMIVVSCLFFHILPILSICMAVGLGILQGLTHEVNLTRYIAHARRSRINST